MAIHNAEDLSDIDKIPASESVSEYPFMDIEALSEKEEEEKKHEERDSSMSEPYQF